MKETIEKNKTSIILSFIIGITLICFQHYLLNFIENKIVDLFAFINSRFSNYLYGLVSQNNPNIINEYQSSLILTLILFGGGWIVGFVLFTKKDLEKELLRLEEYMKRYGNASKKEEENFELEISELIAELKLKFKKVKFISKPMIVVVILSLLYFSVQQGIFLRVNSENLSFNNKLTVLSVYLSDNDIKQMKSKWVQMKSYNDFKKLKKEIDDYNKKFNIK